MTYSFEYFDFIPRKGFKEAADQMLTELAYMLPTESICEARCTYYDQVFFFQIRLINSEVEFKSQIVLNPKKENTADRNWQTKALKKMGEDLKKQISIYLSESTLTA